MQKVGEIGVYVSWRRQYCGILKLEMDNITYYLLIMSIISKETVITGIMTKLSVLHSFPSSAGDTACDWFQADIIHCNDWQTGVVSAFLNAWYKGLDFYKDIKTVFTIHNLKYQGIFPKEVFGEVLGLPWIISMPTE